MSGVQRLAGQRLNLGGRLALNEPTFAVLALLGEIAVIVAAAVASGLAYHLVAYGTAGPIRAHAAIGALAALFFVTPQVARGQYTFASYLHGSRSAPAIASGWIYALFALGCVAFLTKTSALFSRGSVALFAAGGVIALIGQATFVRAWVLRLMRRRRLTQRRIILVGNHAETRRFASLRGAPAALDRVVGVVTLPADAVSATDDTDWRAFDVAMEQAVVKARLYRADDVLLIGPEWSGNRLARALVGLAPVPVAIHREIGPAPAAGAPLRLGRVGNLATLSLSERPLDAFELILKRAFDIAVASLALLLVGPVLLVAALLVKLDSRGPVFFLQRRHGYNQREFRIIKLRTMSTLDDGDVVVQASRNDPRVTRVGRHLRRWNIDELPQLINVLKGDMSIVGPRPHAVAHDRQFGPRIGGYTRRLNVKPGMTGWAQVNGLRGETDTDEKMAARVAADLYYISNWSLWLDISILIRTVLTPLAFRNAH